MAGEIDEAGLIGKVLGRAILLRVTISLTRPPTLIRQRQIVLNWALRQNDVEREAELVGGGRLCSTEPRVAQVRTSGAYVRQRRDLLCCHRRSSMSSCQCQGCRQTAPQFARCQRAGPAGSCRRQRPQRRHSRQRSVKLFLRSSTTSFFYLVSVSPLRLGEDVSLQLP
jgi:hypothetical protein